MKNYLVFCWVITFLTGLPASSVAANSEKILASDGAAFDQFGYSVAFSNSGDTAIVGANADDTAGGAAAGSVTVFIRDGAGTWTPQQQLLAPDGAALDGFGNSVALSSTGDTAIVGAEFDSTAGATPTAATNAGSASVFTRDGAGIWTFQQQLLAPDGATNDNFGNSVTLSSTGDTAIVGAGSDDTAAGTNAGSASVFTRDGAGTWTFQQQLLAPDGAASDQFGTSVALASTGDTAIVGAIFGDSAFRGAAYVFTRDAAGGFIFQQKLLGSVGAVNDRFGISVALSSSGDTAIVGAEQDDTVGGASAGSATVFTRDGAGTWTTQQQLLAPDGAATDLFGSSVSLSSTGNTALVGAQLDDTAGGENAGSASVFTRDGAGIWTFREQLLGPDGAASDRFGQSVALVSTGDAAIVGAYRDSTPAGTAAGSAYVFDFPDTDGDGVPDSVDNCPAVANPDQANNDLELEANDPAPTGDACDPDDDNDGTPDVSDAFPFDPSEQLDTDSDGVGNNADTDDDGDGIPDVDDQDPLDAASCRSNKPELLLVWHDAARLEDDGITPWRAPFGLDVQLDPLSDPIYRKDSAARLPLQSGVSSVFQEQVRSAVAEIFGRADDGLPPASTTFSVGTLSGAVPAQGPGSPAVIYLVDRAQLAVDLDGDNLDDFGDLGGLAWSGIDRFNETCAGGQAAVFVESTDTVAEIAEKAAHEAGHLFGMRHIFASSDFTTGRGTSCDTTFAPPVPAVMDYAFGDEPAVALQACGATGCLVVEPPNCAAKQDTGETHNPRFHFLRYVLGYDALTLSDNGISASGWDDPEPGGEIRVLNIEFSFAKTGLTPCGVEYHDVAIYSQCSADSGEDLIFSAPQMALCEMEDLRILIPETCAFRLVASSIAGGPPDTLLAQVPNNGWTPAQFAIDPPASTVEFPQSMDGTVAIPTMLIKATPDAGGGFTVEGAFPAAETLTAQSSTRYKLTQNGMICDVPTGQTCGSAGQIGKDEVVSPNFTQSKLPRPVVYISNTNQPSQPALGDDDNDGHDNPWDNCRLVANTSQLDTDKDGYGNRCDGDFNGDGKVGGPDFAKFTGAFGSAKGIGTSYNPDVDCNDDGVIGGPDFACFTGQFTNGLGPGGLSCATAPGTPTKQECP